MSSLDERLGEAPVNDETHGRENRAWKEIESETPITTRGDIVVGDAGGVAVRLPLGPEGTVFQSKDGDAKYDTIPGGGGGDMLRSVYNVLEDGVVDNSKLLQGQDSPYHLDRTNHSGTQTVSTISDFDAEVDANTDVAANTTHRGSDGADHSNTVLNDNHRGGNGSDHANVALNDTHRASDGKNHSDVVANNAHKAGNGADHTNVGLNDSHRISDGKGHSDVVLNNSHRASAHAPSDAQKNSDILKSEIEAKLTGEISTHSHAGGGGTPLEVEDEGSSLATDVSKLNFIGAGVTSVENAANEIDITIPGGSGLVLGETDTTAYRGDRGKIAFDHVSEDGKSHSDVVLNNTHRTGDGTDHSGVIPSSEKGAANGVATLDSGSKIPAAQLPASVMEYKGAYNIVTNTPTLIDGTGDNGDSYRCSVGGSRDFGSGTITVLPGDFLIYNGTIWEKIPSEDIVQSVAGKIGIVTLDTDDITEGANLYYLESRVNANTNVAANTTHRGSDGKDHSDVVTNNAKVSNADHTGDVTGDTALTIANDAVTYAKMQNVVADQRILGNIGGAGGIVAELTDVQVRTLINVANGAIANLVEDTTPQLGGDVDLNSNGFQLVGQTVGGSNGDLVYLSSASTFSQADADAVGTCSSMLGIRISATSILTYGPYTTTGLTVGIYYASTTPGGITATAPSGAGDIVRIIGYATSTTELFFDPDKTFITV